MSNHSSDCNESVVISYGIVTANDTNFLNNNKLFPRKIMKQALIINGTEVEYAVNTENVIAILGHVYIYRQPTYTDLLAIIYRGLKSTQGYTQYELVTSVQKGQI